MNKETIVDRIRKLLRLARDKGASEHEAASAMAMAQKLMMQHNIEQVEEQHEEPAIRGEWHQRDIDKKWQLLLVQAVAKLYSCRVVTSSAGAVRFYGKASNVLVCADTLDWIVEQMDDLYKQGLRAFKLESGGSLSQRTRGNFRTTFKEACALRVYHRCAEIVAKARNEIPGHMALVVIDQALAGADDLLKQDNIRSSGKAMNLRSGFGTGAGRTAGDQVKLQSTVAPARRMITG